jgi:hypothetical protein
MGHLGAVFRVIPVRIKTVEELKLPLVLNELVQRRQGIILVTGPTGSGKSTTLAALVNYLNERVDRHILTIEDAVTTTSGNNNNRKIYFIHDTHQDGVAGANLLDQGVTLCFRARLTPQDGKSEITMPNGYGIFSDGKGMFGIRQSSPSELISFSLVLADEDWFKFYVSAADAGKDLKVRLRNTSVPDMTGSRDSDFYVFDSSERLLGGCYSGSYDEILLLRPQNLVPKGPHLLDGIF